jgi:hypothetical protein
VNEPKSYTLAGFEPTNFSVLEADTITTPKRLTRCKRTFFMKINNFGFIVPLPSPKPISPLGEKVHPWGPFSPLGSMKLGIHSDLKLATRIDFHLLYFY